MTPGLLRLRGAVGQSSSEGSSPPGGRGEHCVHKRTQTRAPREFRVRSSVKGLGRRLRPGWACGDSDVCTQGGWRASPMPTGVLQGGRRAVGRPPPLARRTVRNWGSWRSWGGCRMAGGRGGALGSVGRLLGGGGPGRNHCGRRGGVLGRWEQGLSLLVLHGPYEGVRDKPGPGS